MWELPAKRHLKRSIRLPSMMLILFTLLTGFPILLLLVHAIAGTASDNENWIYLVFPSGRRLTLLLQTLLFAVIVALSGTIIGFLGACTLRFTGSLRLRRLAIVLIPSAAIPPHIHAMAWSAFVSAINNMLRNAGFATLPDQGFLISCWVQTMALLPFAFGMLLLGLSALSSDMLESARLLAPDHRNLLRILLPLSAPGLSASFSFLFLISLLDYSVPSLFQVNLYSLGIFSEYSIRYDAGHALLMSVPILCLSIPAAFMLQHALRRLPLVPTRRGQEVRWPLKLPFGMQLAAFLSIVFLLMQLLVPIVVLAVQSFPALSDLDWLLNALPDIGATALIAAGTALLSLPFTHVAAMSIDKKSKGHRLWWLMMILPFAMPAPLVGIALIHAWNGPILGWTGFYGTLIMPILACMLRFLPFAVFLLLSFLKRLDSNLLDAARILQRNNRQTLFQVHLPMLSSAYLGAALLMAVLAIGELGATLLLIPPGFGTLTLKIYNYLHYGQSEVVSGLCLLLYGIALTVGLILQKTAYAGQGRLK